MKRKFLLILICSILSACVTHVPLSVQTEKNENFTGETKGSIFEASFHVVNAAGVTCNGPIPLGNRTTKLLSFDCSDGRHGKVMVSITRDASQISGFGSGTMNDGTKFTFKFGNHAQDKL